jgi:2-oxoglutarate ferredoxin oxidoreductase subunit alpha
MSLPAAYFIDGNEAIAHAAVDSGCRFFAGYPITPATTIFHHMLRLLPPVGGICLQGEDEIASIGFCLGASMTGLKVMTATSGPGISLFSEQISFAIGGEIPIVIVDVQRLGPSTGSATKGADSDIKFLRWGNSGGLPVIVLAPVDSADCYNLTWRAFNLAERFRTPVFIASNKEIGMTRESVPVNDFLKPESIERKLFEAVEPRTRYLPFATSAHGLVPDFLPIGDAQLVRQTSSTHGPDGYITADVTTIEQNILRLRDKLLRGVGDFTYYDLDRSEDADTLIITYGVSSRAAVSAMTALRQASRKVSLLILKTLYPVPESLLDEEMRRVCRVLVVEMNLGQYVEDIRRIAGKVPVHFVGKMNGELITPEEIQQAF